MGSEIVDIEDCILYQSNPQKSSIQDYLTQLNYDKLENNIEREREENIEKFVYEFENCSQAHRRSDGYKFYFSYNIAFHVAVQLNRLCKGEIAFNFLPKNFISNILNREEQNIFYDIKGTLFLPEANKQKRKLLEFFYNSIQKVISEDKYKETKTFCEWIFERDFLWNFRDINAANPIIKKGIIYRTATLSLFQEEAMFQDFLEKKQIKTIIDLRAEREIAEYPYSDATLHKFHYQKAPFDPCSQPKWFEESEHCVGTNSEIAYRFFLLCCKAQIKTVVEALLFEKKGAVAIHCFAGKDRTGIVVSLLHLLINSPLQVVYDDYLASENDVKASQLAIVLDLIEQEGGILSYLLSCGLSENQLQQLTQKLLHGNA